MKSRRDLLVGAVTSAACTLPLLARAQPQNLHRIVVGFAPGGSTDVMARMLAQRLQLKGGTWIVDNKPGAAGRVAIQEVKNAPADGRTLLLTPDPMMTLYPLVYRRLSYDPVADFQPVTPIATVPMGLAVGPMVPASVKTLADFAQWCKEDPKRAAYGTAGAERHCTFVGAPLCFRFSAREGMSAGLPKAVKTGSEASWRYCWRCQGLRRNARCVVVTRLGQTRRCAMNATSMLKLAPYSNRLCANYL